MERARVEVLVVFGSVAAGIAGDRNMARHIRYQAHAQVLRDHARYDWQAVVDPDPKARERAARDWNVPLVAATPGDLPPDFQPEVAVLAVPPAARLAVLEQLPTVGVAVFEKSLGETLAAARTLVSACARRKGGRQRQPLPPCRRRQPAPARRRLCRTRRRGPVRLRRLRPRLAHQRAAYDRPRAHASW